MRHHGSLYAACSNISERVKHVSHHSDGGEPPVGKISVPKMRYSDDNRRGRYRRNYSSPPLEKYFGYYTPKDILAKSDYEENSREVADCQANPFCRLHMPRSEPYHVQSYRQRT